MKVARKNLKGIGHPTGGFLVAPPIQQQTGAELIVDPAMPDNSF